MGGTDLFLSSSCSVPLFSEFPATPDIGNSQNGTICLEESKNGGTKERVNGYTKATITLEKREGKPLLERLLGDNNREGRVEWISTVLDGWSGAIELGGFMTNEEHWNLSSVFTLIPHLSIRY